MARVWGKMIGWLIIAIGLPMFSALAAEHGSNGPDQGSGGWQTLPTELIARAASQGTWTASPGSWTARSTSSHRSNGNGKRGRSNWHGYRRGHSYFVGTGGYNSWDRPLPKVQASYSRPRNTSNYGPIVRRDTCSPKVYVIDPESGEIEIYCGNVKQQP